MLAFKRRQTQLVDLVTGWVFGILYFLDSKNFQIFAMIEIAAQLCYNN